MIIKHRLTGTVIHSSEGGLYSDLSDLDLSYGDFSGMNLERVTFHNSNLFRADLRSAELLYTKLSYVNCAEADFEGATIAESSFSDVNLQNANFSRAGILFTQIANTDFTGADFTDAGVNGLKIIECPTLHRALGLATVDHEGNSAIDLATLRSSVVSLPGKFLSGIGLSDNEMTLLKDFYGVDAQPV